MTCGERWRVSKGKGLVLREPQREEFQLGMTRGRTHRHRPTKAVDEPLDEKES